MGRMDGKVIVVTGAGRGQGRAHAERFAQEGANVIAIDACKPMPSAPYDMSTPEDLADTVASVEAIGRRCVSYEVDVRDYAGLKEAIDSGAAKLGGLDTVIANAGILNLGAAVDLEDDAWDETIAVNLTGVWHTCKAAIPHLIARGGGSISITSSNAGLSGLTNIAHYTAAKHGVVGLMRTLANELAPHMIRVNTVHPTNVATPMTHNEAMFKLFRPDLEEPSVDDMREPSMALNALPVPWVEPIDIANAMLFLASDEARYITGVTLPVDAGFLINVAR